MVLPTMYTQPSDGDIDFLNLNLIHLPQEKIFSMLFRAAMTTPFSVPTVQTHTIVL